MMSVTADLSIFVHHRRLTNSTATRCILKLSQLCPGAYLRANLINFELKDGYLALKINYSSEWLDVCVLKVYLDEF